MGNAVADALGIPHDQVVKFSQGQHSPAGGVKMVMYTAFDHLTVEGKAQLQGTAAGK